MRRQRVIGLALLAPWCLGIDWPGAERGLSTEMATATAPRRIEILELAAEGRSAGSEVLLLRGLRDEDPGVRLAAAELSGRYQLRAALPTLGTWLGDSRAEARAAAAAALGALGDPGPLAALVRALGDSDVTVRLRAVGAIASIGSVEGTIPLLGRVTDSESSVRVAAAVALGQMGDPRAVLSLLGALQDPIADVRQAAALALGRLHDPRGLQGLQALLHDAQGEVRVTATRAIASLGESTTRASVADLAALALREERGADPTAAMYQARAAVQALGRIGGESACDVLVQVFRAGDNDLALADLAATQLVQMRELTARRIEFLTAPPVSGVLRSRLVSLLGRVGGDDAARAILSILSESALSPGLRDEALRALGRTGSSQALMLLLGLCAGSGSATEAIARPRSAAFSVALTVGVDVSALEGLRLWCEARGELDGRAFDPLMDALRGPLATSPQRVETVARLLGYTRSSRVPFALALMLDASHERVRTAAAEALLRAGITGVEARVVAALSDASPTVRALASEALSRHGAATAREAILLRWGSAMPGDRAGMVRALGRIGGRAPSGAVTSLLVGLVDRAVAPLAATALDALSDLAASGDESARGSLLSSLGSPSLGATAMESLGNAFASALPERRAVLLPTLMSSSREGAPWVRAAAVWALGRGGSAAIPTLVSSVGDAHPAIAANAAGALARIAEDVSVDLSSAREALCGAARDRTHAVLRANALWAIARGRLRCDDLGLRRLLLESRSPWVRAGAAEALRGVLSSEPSGSGRFNQLRVALEQCAEEDTERFVAARCALRSAPTAVQSPPRWSEVDAVIVDESGQAASRAPYGLSLPEGLIRMGETGADGWVHERRVMSGRFMVIEP